MTRRRSLRVAPLCCAVTLGAASICSPLHAAPMGVSDAAQEQKSAAQKTFEAGDGLYEGGRFEQALTAFRASYEIVQSPNTRLMAARCLRELGRVAEAFREFDGTIELARASGGRYAEAEEAARAERDALAGSIGHVVVSAGDGSATGFTMLGRDYDAGDFGAAIPVVAGEVSIGWIVNGKLGEQRSIAVAAGATVRVAPPPSAPAERASKVPARSKVRVTPRAEPEPASLRPYAFVAAGVGAAGLVTFTVFALKSRSTYASLKDACPDGACPPDRLDDIDAGRRDQTIANIGLAIGVAGVGAGVALYLVSPTTGESGHVSARVGPASVSLEGAF